MARFYRTASSNPLDYMYKINAPLMQAVLGAQDQYISENLNQLGQMSQTASTIPSLTPDNARVEQIMGDYNKQIDEITNAIKSDPANWRKQVDPIRTIGRDLANNYRSGEISKIVGNYNSYKAVSDKIDKQVEEFSKSGKGISADRARAYKQHFLNEFINANPNGTAFDPKTREYNAIKAFDPMANMDVRKVLSDELDKMKADGTIQVREGLSGNGEYFNKETQKWEGVSPEKILRIASSRLNNPQLMDYLKQDSMVGIVKGVYDTDPNSENYGKFIQPYSYNKVDYSSAEKKLIDDMQKKIEKTTNSNTKQHLEEQLASYRKNLDNRSQVAWNKDSYLAPIMRGVVDEFSYGKTSTENDMTANSSWQTRFSQAQQNARQQRDIAADEATQARLFDQQKKLQDDRLQAEKDLKLLEWNNKKPAAGKAVPGAKTNTDNMVVGSSYTSPYYWMSENKDKMTQSLNDEVKTHQYEVKQLEKTLAEIVKNNPDNKIMIANAENQIAATKAKLNTLEDQRQNSIDYAVNQWKAQGTKSRGFFDRITGDAPVSYSPENEKMMREYVSGKAKENYDNANAELLKAEAAKNKMEKGSPEYVTFLRNTYYPARDRKATTEALFTSGQRIFNEEVKPFSDSKLEKAAKETTNKADIIATTDAQDNVVYDMISTTPSNYKIMNNEGKEINLSFEHGTAPTDKAKFKINGVSATTGLGDKGVEIAATINGQNVIITPKEDGNRIGKYFADEFKKSKNPEINNIGKIISSPTAGTINDMLTELRMNTNTKLGTKDAWVYRTIPNPANPRDVMKIRIRAISTGAGEPKWEVQGETSDPTLIMKNMGRNADNSGKASSFEIDGNKIKGFAPMPSTTSRDGVYHNLTDILTAFGTNQ